ncbi:hypothetical protein Sango_1920900 [Sesamum angolense]|uniref:Uncharacterized protein n=1 Tax=Sesamum angolense TaxID=2727404 RepID=A0AAE2BN17_9LAMI|nr:hypothetical protein Sango_1920900 [Sesamum angolense]
MEGCRPIIGLDGCFLKIIYGGQLLVAVGRDGNDNMFPIAMAIVQVENKDTRGWFVAIGSKRARLDDYVVDFYKKLVYLKVYTDMIHAVPGAKDYIKTIFQPFKPPKIKKKMGRPKKLRRKGPNELQPNTSMRKAKGTRHEATSVTQPPAPRTATQAAKRNKK